MTSLEEKKDLCQRTSAISNRVVDGFLLYYAANRERLEPEMKRLFSRYRRVTASLPPGAVNFMKAQYIAHRIFMNGGLIRGYLNAPEIKRLPEEDRAYLSQQAEHPWRFSFGEVRLTHAHDFFSVDDVFTGENLLIYSPGMTSTLRETGVRLWFNLLAYNGACWQTYGPIGAYLAFEPDDIFFFATELNPAIRNEKDLMADVARNPVPYMMLLTGSRYPVLFHRKDQMVQLLAEQAADPVNMYAARAHFTIGYSEGCYRLALKRWSGFPHFAIAYYDEHEHTLALTAMTDRGFRQLASRLRAAGFNAPEEPDVRLNSAMHTTAEEILGKVIHVNSYEKRFPEKETPEEDQALAQINEVLELALPEINAGRQPDFRRLAASTGVDPETVKQILERTMRNIESARKKK